MVDPADAVRPPRSCRRSTSPTDGSRSPSNATGMPPSKSIVTSTGRGIGRGDRPLVGVGGRRDPRILEHPGLTRPTPQVDVDRVGEALVIGISMPRSFA